jgi:hypothetical protein
MGDPKKPENLPWNELHEAAYDGADPKDEDPSDLQAEAEADELEAQVRAEIAKGKGGQPPA